jgi:membrane protease YdiL (CAAX protease family)
MTQTELHLNEDEHAAQRRALVVVVLVSLIAAFLPKFLAMNGAYNQARLRPGIDFLLISHPLFRVIVVCIGIIILRRALGHRRAFTLGLRLPIRRVTSGLLIGLGCSIPMLAIGLVGGLKDADYRYMYAGTLIAALNEEFVFRAFAFGLLVQVSGIRLWPAAISTGLLFGMIHISFAPASGESIVDQIDLFLLMTTLGGVLYAWLYHRSRYNLWLVISLHFFMNLWFTLFDVGGSALGAWGVTASRVACVTVAIFLLIYLHPSPATIGDDPAAEDNG